MGGVDWKKWQEDQDRRNGPNARNPQPAPSTSTPKKENKVLTAEDLKPAEPSPDFPDTVDD